MTKFTKGVSGNPGGRPKGTTNEALGKSSTSRVPTNPQLVKCLKKFGPAGVNAMGDYLSHYRLRIEDCKKELGELDINMAGMSKTDEDYPALNVSKSILSSQLTADYENYYKAGGKLADLMQSMLKHEVASGTSKPEKEDTPKVEEDTTPIFSTSSN